MDPAHRLREARTAPWAPAGATQNAGQCLSILRWRGRCDRLVVENPVRLADAVRDQSTASALQSWSPPPAVGAMGRSLSLRGWTVAAAGTAGWSGRAEWDSNATRAALVAAARGLPHQRAEAAVHSTNSEALRDGLSTDPDRTVRQSVARHHKSSPSALALLAADTDSWIRSTVGQHPRCPPVMLAALATDTDPDIRETAAKHPRCPSEMLDILSGDQHLAVRAAVAENSNTGPFALARLAEGDTKMAVAQHPRCPSGALARLAEEDDHNLRTAVAQHPNTSVGTLERFASDSFWPMRHNVATSETCPPQILARLAGDEEKSVCHAVASNPNTSIETLQHLAGDDRTADAADANLRSRKPPARISGSQNPRRSPYDTDTAKQRRSFRFGRSRNER